MKKLELTLWVVVVVGALLKVAHLPFSSLLLILGLSALSLVYFWLSWLVFPQPTRKDHIMAVSILSGIALSFGLLGILFKLQLWPMAGLYLVIGIVGSAALSVTVLIIRNSRADLLPYCRGLLIRFIPVLVACVGLYLLPSGSLTAFYYKDDPDRAAIMQRMNATQDPVERGELMLQLDSINSVR